MRRVLSPLAALALLAPSAAAQSRSEAAAAPAPSRIVLGSGATARKTPSDPRERALWQAAEAIRNDADAGTLSRPNARKPVPAGAAQAVVAIMTEPSAEADAQLRNALTMSGRGEGDANGLIGALANVLSDPSNGRTRNARERLDDFMKDASESFRVNPPAEVQAIDAVLARLAAAETGYVAGQRNAKAEREAARKAKREEEKRAAAARKSAKTKPADRKAREKARADSLKAEKARAEQEKKEAEKAARARADSVKAEKERAEKTRADSAKAATRQARSQVSIKKYSQPQPAAKP